MNSVLQSDRKCWVCGTTHGLHRHHVLYGNPNRTHSERYGYTVYLCAKHHNMSSHGVHFNKELDHTLKLIAQKHFENHHGSREDWIRIFGRSYL